MHAIDSQILDNQRLLAAAAAAMLQSASDWAIEVLVFFVRQLTLWNTVSKQEYSVLRCVCGLAWPWSVWEGGWEGGGRQGGCARGV
jgi:hypothetical protein